MDVVKESIQQIKQNPGIAVGAAALLLIVAGIVTRKLRVLFFLSLGAAFILYMLLGADKIGKKQIDDIRKKVKNKVIQSL